MSYTKLLCVSQVYLKMDEWLQETEESLLSAITAVSSGEIPKENMYKLAPLFFAERQNIKRVSLLEEMSEANEQQVQTDCSFDPNSIKQYKFNYVSSYLFCFVVAGKIDEFKYDEIMEHVNQKIDLF